MLRSRPLLLDLFCGEGGAAIGYRRAGFDIVGVDKYAMPRYPFPLIRQDIRDLRLDLSRFDAIHASPPCQAHTPLRAMWGIDNYQTYIPLTHEILSGFNGPWSIENVVGSWLLDSVTVCGAAMGCYIDRPYKYVLRRHRLFATNFPTVVPVCRCREFRDRGYKVLGVYGHGTHAPGDCIKLRRRIMKIPHASSDQLSQAIPPPYTFCIGRQMMGALGA